MRRKPAAERYQRMVGTIIKNPTYDTASEDYVFRTMTDAEKEAVALLYREDFILRIEFSHPGHELTWREAIERVKPGAIAEYEAPL
jgi:hypothetical protein